MLIVGLTSPMLQPMHTPKSGGVNFNFLRDSDSLDERMGAVTLKGWL